MDTLEIDGTEIPCPNQELTVTELIAEIRAELPAHMLIARVAADGRTLDGEQWEQKLSEITGQLSVQTAEKYQHLTLRLQTAQHYLTQISAEFSHAALQYHQQEKDNASAALNTAADNFLAFVNWYATLLLLDREALESAFDQFHQSVAEIHGVCEQIVEQQLAQNVWVLGEIIESRLMPELSKLQRLCTEVGSSYHTA